MFQTVLVGSGSGQSMAFDSTNNLHVSYVEDYVDLRHAVFNGSNWTSSAAIDAWTDNGAVAVDLLGRPHIVYLSQPPFSPDAIKHAAYNGSGWTTETVAQWTSTISGPETEAVAIDRWNNMHVIFADDNKDLYYATCNLGNELVLTPTVDFEGHSSDGVHFTVIDGSSSIFTQEVPWADVYRRGVMEFNIASLPEGLVIESATLELDINLFSGYPSLHIFGYAGDGVMGTADPTFTSVLIGQSDPITELEPITIELDAEFIDSLLGESEYLGLVAFEPVTGGQVRFWASEAAAYAMPPTLTLTYAGPAPSIPGDTNHDGRVDATDAAVVAANWGQSVSGKASDGDFDGDGTVGPADASILAAHWSPSPGEETAVPEPSTSVLLLFAVFLTFLSRRRR